MTRTVSGTYTSGQNVYGCTSWRLLSQNLWAISVNRLLLYSNKYPFPGCSSHGVIEWQGKYLFYVSLSSNNSQRTHNLGKHSSIFIGIIYYRTWNNIIAQLVVYVYFVMLCTIVYVFWFLRPYNIVFTVW